MSECTAEVYHTNGAFLVLDTSHVLQLRHRRIISQPVSSGGYPAMSAHCLSPYAARVAALNGLATFKQLEAKQNISLEENKTRYELELDRYTAEQRNLFTAQRIAELKRHNVPETAQNIGKFNEAKMRLPIKSVPSCTELSSFDEVIIQPNDVVGLVEGVVNRELKFAFDDLYKRGFYVTSGIKFGGDFLAYPGDPIRYHAQYVVRVVPGDASGQVDLRELDFSEINSFQRLTHAAKKISLFVTVLFAAEKQQPADPTLTYWTLKERIYLTPDSKSTEFDTIEPRLGAHNSQQPARSSPMPR
jgi:tRNA splicing endonuclease